MEPEGTDFFTTIVFTTTISVCSLDFLLAMLISLGSSYKVSTLGINLARDCLIKTIYLEFPELAMSTLIVSN